MINIDKYPMTYSGKVNKSQEKTILDTVAYFKKKSTKDYHKILNCLESLGIMVEYNWHGHRKELFLATYSDAIYEEDCVFENL